MKFEHEGIKVDLGCGTEKPDGYFGIDISEESNADEIRDVRKGLPFCTSSIDEVRAHSVLEHFTNDEFIALMWEIWRVLKPLGETDFFVPHGLSETGIKDPTHKMSFSNQTFTYFENDTLRQKQYNFPPFIICRNKRIDDMISAKLKAVK